jgi:hypothetical protein
MRPRVKLPAWARASEGDSSEVTLVGAFIFHFFIIIRYPSLAWADEIFQTVEQGHRLAFGYGVVPWEFRDGIRSWVLPGALAGVMRLTAFLGKGSAGYLLGLHLFLAVCSVFPVAYAMAWARRAKLPYPWLAGIVTAAWFELVFFSGKALTEVFAGYAIAAALYYSVFAREESQRRATLLAGIAWGFAVGFRVHLAPAALVAMIWVCRKDLPRWRDLMAGFAGVIVAFGLLDWATWSYPFQSFFLNFWVNVVEGKAASFGVRPPWEYAVSMALVWSWAAIPLLGLAWPAFKRWPILGITAAVIFLTHSAIGHKEYRFLMPLLVIVVIAAALGLLELLKTKRQLGLAACGILMLGSIDGARRFDWNDLAPRPPPGRPPESMWTFRGATLTSFAFLSTNDAVCGVGAVGIGWGWTGGYSHLHKNVPLFDIRSDEELAANTPFFNAMVASRDNGEKIAVYEKQTCWAELCFYLRPGPCQAPADYNINSWLELQGR